MKLRLFGHPATAPFGEMVFGSVMGGVIFAWIAFLFFGFSGFSEMYNLLGQAKHIAPGSVFKDPEGVIEGGWSVTVSVALIAIVVQVGISLALLNGLLLSFWHRVWLQRRDLTQVGLYPIASYYMAACRVGLYLAGAISILVLLALLGFKLWLMGGVVPGEWLNHFHATLKSVVGFSNGALNAIWIVFSINVLYSLIALYFFLFRVKPSQEIGWVADGERVRGSSSHGD